MKSARIIVVQVVDNTLSNSSGVQLQVAINQMLADNSIILLSFHGVINISTSFLNSSLGNLADQHGFDILSRIRIVDYTPTVAAFLKKYIADLKSISA